MNPHDPLAALWQQQPEAPRTPPQQLVQKAERLGKKERTELVFAIVALLSTSGFFLFQAYLLREMTGLMLLLIGMAIFLGFASARIYRHSRRYKTPIDMDTHSYLLNLRNRRDGNRQMERFIYFVYMPVLALGVCAGLWLALSPLELWIRLAAIGGTLTWVVIAGFWGRYRQQKKRDRLNTLISQLENTSA